MYELMELSTGNLVGAYPSQDIALLVVLETIKVSGEQAIATVALGLDDPSGETDGQLIAEGPALVEMARTRYGIVKTPVPSATYYA